MNTRQLEFLVTCAREGSIAAAARMLGVAQPSISQQIANLEHELRSRLLKRDHRGVTLTEAGRCFLPVAEHALQQLVQTRDLLRSGGAPCGRVVLGMTQPSGNALAMPLFEAARQYYPDIELDLYTGLSSSLYEQLSKGDIDVLVCSDDASPHMGMVSQPLLKERLFLAVGTRKDGAMGFLAERDEIDFAELANFRVMYTTERDSLGFRVAQYEQMTGIQLQRQRPFGQLLTSLRYVSEGYGTMICASTAVHPQVSQGGIRLIPIVNPEMNRTVNLVTLHGRTVGLAQRVVTEMIRDISHRLVAEQVWLGEALN